MDYVVLIVSGVIMGLTAAAPVGPVNLICIRRTFAFGPLNGFMSGLGAALGDGAFAVVVGFGLTTIAKLIEGYAGIIQLVGGTALIVYGVKTFVAPPEVHIYEDGVRIKKDKGASTLLRAMVSTFALTVTNPATLLFFTGMFASGAGLASQSSYINAAVIVGGVVGGSAGWWLILTTFMGIFHAKITDRGIRLVNRYSGVVMALIGVGALVHLTIESLGLVNGPP